MRKLNLLITGAGGPAVPSMIKILKNKRNCNIISIDANKYSSGFLLSDKFYVVPMGHHKSFKKIVKEILIKNRIQIIISVVDEELLIFSKLSKELGIICLQPKLSFIQVTLDKKKCSLMQKKIGLESLDTKLLSEIKNNQLSRLKFPLIIKPRFGRGSRGVSKISNEKKLQYFLEKKKIKKNQWIIQRYIDGPEFTVSVVCTNSKTNFAIVPKKIVLKKGITKIAYSCFNKSIEEVCRKIIIKMNPKGPFNVQCRIDKLTNKVYIFEINPRFSTSTTLTVASGVDEINDLIDISLGKKILLNQIKWKQNISMIRNYTDYFSKDFSFD